MAKKKVVKKKVVKKTAAKKAKFSIKRATKAADEQIAKLVKNAAPKGAVVRAAQQSAFIDYYLLIDFGFTSGQPFQPNSVQFYSNTQGFLCYKTVDNASLVSLTPILECDNVRVTWNTSTKEAMHIYGMQTK